MVDMSVITFVQFVEIRDAADDDKYKKKGTLCDNRQHKIAMS